MKFKFPKNDKYQWTQHSAYKMRQYGLSPQRVTRVIRNPQRIEEGIVEKTIAVMQPASRRRVSASLAESRRASRGGPARETWSQEIWVMYQIKNQNAKIKNQNENTKFKDGEIKSGKLINPQVKKLKIISAWRYPGISPKNNPIPEEILEEIRSII